MDTVRLKYVGDEPFLDRSLNVPVQWNPGDVRRWPRRFKPDLAYFKPMKGQAGKNDLPLPIKIFPDENLTVRDLEWSIKCYSLDELHEMLDHYKRMNSRFFIGLLIDEIETREYDGED